jgi:hypothetical protein
MVGGLCLKEPPTWICDTRAMTIIRADLTATDLRQAAACSNDANAARLMLGLALVLEGYARGEEAPDRALRQALCAKKARNLRTNRVVEGSSIMF